MLNTRPNFKAFVNYELLVVSKDQSFCDRVDALSSQSFSSHLRYFADLPSEDQLNENMFYVLVMDVKERPERTLHWLSKVRQQGIDMPVIAMNNWKVKDQSHYDIRRVYDVMSWRSIDLMQTSSEKWTHSLSLLLMEYNVIDTALPLQAGQSEYLLAFNAIEEVIVKLDENLCIEYANAAAEQMLGVKSNDLKGIPFLKKYAFFESESKTSINALLERTLNAKSTFKRDGPLLLLGNNEQITYVGIACAPIVVNETEHAGYFLILRDLTEHQSLSSKLHYHYSHDQLSGLLSRMEFEARLQQAIISANDMTTDKPKEHVLIYLDVDQFRIINDTCGHAVGDELIRQFSVELSSIVRQRDTLARVGGDEFAIILWNCPEEKGIEIANHIRSHIEAFRFVWIDKVHQITVSIGLTPVKQGMLSSWAEALRLVDSACNAAKELGRNRVEITNPDDKRMQDRYGEMEWVHRLVAAVEGEGLLLFCQAIHPLGQDRCEEENSHFEVLVRYQDADGKMVPPGVFLPPAERYNLIGMLDRWVVRSTLKWIASVQDSKKIDICSINLSGASMCDHKMPEYIKDTFEETGVDPNCVCFEITETVAVTNIAFATDFIRELKAIGCKFALDDFGVGMSSFAYLKHMDVDFVKIDGSFVKNIASDAIDKEMVRSINDIGHILGKKTVAEFCEDQTSFDILENLGVDYVQGYFIGKPQPIDCILNTATINPPLRD